MSKIFFLNISQSQRKVDWKMKGREDCTAIRGMKRKMRPDPE